MEEIFAVTTKDKEEFLVLYNKFSDSLKTWNDQFPNFKYELVEDLNTLKITIYIQYVTEKTKDSTEDSSRLS